MKTMRAAKLGLCLFVLGGLTLGPAAGIGARGDEAGRYGGTSWRVDSAKPLGNIWSTFNDGLPSFSLLNPAGDLNGDLWPCVAENTVAPNHPWVVWSRFNGRDYDLAWSRWKGARWTAIRSVHAGTAAGDDLDADLTFDAQGRPYMVWWRNERGVGRVYLSVFLNARWMGAFQISDLSWDSRYPTIEIFDGGRIVVEYETETGLHAQVVRFNQPVTITDDINPFAHVELIGKATIVRRR